MTVTELQFFVEFHHLLAVFAIWSRRLPNYFIDIKMKLIKVVYLRWLLARLLWVLGPLRKLPQKMCLLQHFRTLASVSRLLIFRRSAVIVIFGPLVSKGPIVLKILF